MNAAQRDLLTLCFWLIDTARLPAMADMLGAQGFTSQCDK
jgi:hypothetical protein